MEQTLGKRIVSLRKGLGLTQDQLAERLGVTAQAVSKWENDQSCPDIAMLPKLAEIFDCTTDTLLGIQKEQVREVELVTVKPEDKEPEGLHFQNNHWEFRWDGGRRSDIGIAVWVILTGAVLMISRISPSLMDCGFWEGTLFSALLTYGLFGLYPKFSVLRLGCALLGGYCLADNLVVMTVSLNKELFFPVFLVIFGLSLLVDTLRKPDKRGFRVTKNGENILRNHCDIRGETFSNGVCFGEDQRLITMPRLSSGKAEVSFGDLTLDLSGCEEIVDGCRLDLNCSFGEMELLIPDHCRVKDTASTSFGAMEIEGKPAADAAVTVYVDANVSFGNITVKYI